MALLPTVLSWTHLDNVSWALMLGDFPDATMSRVVTRLPFGAPRNYLEISRGRLTHDFD